MHFFARLFCAHSRFGFHILGRHWPIRFGPGSRHFRTPDRAGAIRITGSPFQRASGHRRNYSAPGRLAGPAQFPGIQQYLPLLIINLFSINRLPVSAPAPGTRRASGLRFSANRLLATASGRASAGGIAGVSGLGRAGPLLFVAAGRFVIIAPARLQAIAPRWQYFTIIYGIIAQFYWAWFC